MVQPSMVESTEQSPNPANSRSPHPSRPPLQHGMDLGKSGSMITVGHRQSEGRPGGHCRTGGGEIQARIRHVGNERVILSDGTVLGIPWFMRRTSERLKIGTMLRAKYEEQNQQKVIVFIEVSPGSGADAGA